PHPEFPAQFPPPRRPGILDDATLTLGDRPSAIVLVAPERPAGMDQQHQQPAAFTFVEKDAGALGGHSAPHARHETISPPGPASSALTDLVEVRSSRRGPVRGR